MKNLKRLGAIVLAIIAVGGMCFLSWDYKLRASQDDGSTTAAQQQQMAMAQTLMQNANKMGEAAQEGSMLSEINKKLAGGMDGI